jgi:uncharacterized protein YecT (DUF1311 family)
MTMNAKAALRALALTLALCLFCGFANAEEDDDRTEYQKMLDTAEKTYDACMEKASATMEMAACMDAGAKELTGIITKCEAALQMALKKDLKLAGALNNEKKTWTTLRDATLKNMADNAAGGSMDALDQSGVNYEMLKNRAELLVWLQATLNRE